MRYLFGLALMLGAYAHACPNVTGNFTDSMSEGRTLITQLSQTEDCSEFTRVWEMYGSDGKLGAQVSQTFKTDGLPAQVQFDFEGTMVNATASFTDTGIALSFDLHPDATGDAIRYSDSVLYLDNPADPKTDLLNYMTLLTADGAVMSKVTARSHHE